MAGILTRFYNKFLLDIKNDRVIYPGKPNKNFEVEDQAESKNRHVKHGQKQQVPIKKNEIENRDIIS